MYLSSINVGLFNNFNDVILGQAEMPVHEFLEKC